jgi:hypothetical protein
VVSERPRAHAQGHGQILQLLAYRGLLERFDAARSDLIPAIRIPFGGLHYDFTHLADPPTQLLPLPQPRLERLLAELAGELGAEIRRGQEVVGLSLSSVVRRAIADAPIRHAGYTAWRGVSPCRWKPGASRASTSAWCTTTGDRPGHSELGGSE